MEKIYSNQKFEMLLQIIIRRDELAGNSRINFCPEQEYLQIGTMDIKKGKRYQSHYHVEQDKPSGICQESWVVIQGSILCYLYDIDQQLIKTVIINEGDCVLTFRGGHGYEGIGENSLVYEFKTGPFWGGDKKFIKD